MPREEINPFQPSDVDHLNQLIDHVESTKAFGEKCRDCGLAVAESLQETQAHLDFLNGLKRRFFPGAV